MLSIIGDHFPELFIGVLTLFSAALFFLSVEDIVKHQSNERDV